MSQRGHHLAESLGIEVVMGNQIDGQIGSLCSIAFGAAYKLTSRRAGELSNFPDMSDELLATPPEIVNGEMLVRQGPGRGVESGEVKVTHNHQDSSIKSGLSRHQSGQPGDTGHQ